MFFFVFFFFKGHYIYFSFFTESAEASRGGGCFKGDSTVQTPNGTLKMSQLRIGDQVLVVKPDGSLDYSEIILFLDRDEEKHRLFNTIVTESGTRVTLTPSHLIFGSENNRTLSLSEGYATFAKNIEIGDYLYVSHNGSISLERVIDVLSSSEQGSFAPLTREGNLIVNHIVASCYALLDDQTLAHFAFIPVRFITNVEQTSSQVLDNLHWYLVKLRNAILDYTSNATLFSLLPETFRTNARHAIIRFLQQLPSVELRTHKTIPSQKGIHWYPELLYKVTYRLLPENLLYL